MNFIPLSLDMTIRGGRGRALPLAVFQPGQWPNLDQENGLLTGCCGEIPLKIEVERISVLWTASEELVHLAFSQFPPGLSKN